MMDEEALTSDSKIFSEYSSNGDTSDRYISAQPSTRLSSTVHVSAFQ